MSASALPLHDYSRVVVTTMKDEAPYILDWIAYHLAIGFTHFVIMTNDCSDGTDKICRNLEKIGLITHGNNKTPHPKGIQKTAYQRMQRFEAVQQADWLIPLDVDEYLRIDVGGGTLDDVFAFTGQSFAISFVWQIFGNNDVIDLRDQPVIEQFTQASEIFQAQPYQIRGLKTLFRRDCFEKIGTHRPINAIKEKTNGRNWIDANGVPIPHMLVKNYWCAWNTGLAFGTALGRVNHYAIRSRQAFLLKLARGFVNRKGYGIRSEESPMTYWEIFDWNIVENTNILTHIERTNAIKAELMQIDKITRLHQNGFNHHVNEVQNAIKIPEIKEYVDTIMNIPSRRNYENYTALETNNPHSDQWHFALNSFQTRLEHSILPKSLLKDYVS